MEIIDKSIKSFIEGNGEKNKGRNANERYASFDYCFNYFKNFSLNNNIQSVCNKENILNSSLHISFYLASWGMLRGSSFLLERSVKFYEHLIRLIAGTGTEAWNLDVINYNDPHSISLLFDLRENIIDSLGRNNNPSDTLITKIMLGVFGNIPAYDQYFKKAFQLSTFNKASLIKIYDFYMQNQEQIDGYKINTLDYHTGNETNICYPKAKIVDMIGFTAGMDNSVLPIINRSTSNISRSYSALRQPSSTKVPVREMVREAVLANGGKTTNKAIREYILEKYEGVNPSTINCQIIACTVNHPSRVHYPPNDDKRSFDDRYDFLFTPAKSIVEMYNIENHGVWAIIKNEFGKLQLQKIRKET